MKKYLLLLCCLAVPLKAEAVLQPLNETYTGHTASQAADTPFVTDGFSMLGGPVGNSYVVKRAEEFTINKPSVVQYLSVDAFLNPSLFKYDFELQAYAQELRNEGATIEELGEKLPLFVGSPQGISVDFALMKGSHPSPTNAPKPFPDNVVLAHANYTFFTDDGLHNKTLDDVLIPFAPFETELDRHEEYWIMANNTGGPGVTMRYETKLFGQVNTPEPPSGILLVGGLMALLWRGRKRQW
jgi:hypothetical protein